VLDLEKAPRSGLAAGYKVAIPVDAFRLIGTFCEFLDRLLGLSPDTPTGCRRSST
jgi:hypothetical protein